MMRGYGPFLAVLAAVDGEVTKPPNLWGALGCALAYSAALFATVDSFADLIVARGAAGATRLSAALKLKFGSKLAAAGVTVVAAGLVLALDSNWFAFAALTTVFALFVAISWLVVISRRVPLMAEEQTRPPAGPRFDVGAAERSAGS